MADTPSRPAAPHKHNLRRRDLCKWPHLVMRGLWELLRARGAIAKIEPNDIRQYNAAAQLRADRRQETAIDQTKITQICFVLTHLSRMVPWRSDCVPQALAAQNWLSTKGVASEIQIGAEHPKDGDFGAHAWLMHEGKVILGGDIDRFTVLIGESN